MLQEKLLQRKKSTRSEDPTIDITSEKLAAIAGTSDTIAKVYESTSRKIHQARQQERMHRLCCLMHERIFHLRLSEPLTSRNIIDVPPNGSFASSYQR
ncbi:hypothetical protein AVEN_34066-1 [Araneus ventricosus]|uniref:Uncharacterized protein n=1 Tax=Araneus ventricosus TaxID=182803 RepID=A0A4Y2JIH8_ARAVE|nr:hypothetical protein AVEN_34066-1 [Araneus ventricosus]